MSGEQALEIFRNEEDWADWDRYIQLINALSELTVEQRERASEAFQYLRTPEVLGEKFLASNKKHPLYDYFTGTSPWTGKIKRLTRFSEAMRDLREAEGFLGCVRDVILKDSNKFIERESVLELAYKFLNVGFKPSFDQKATVLKPRGSTRRLLPFQTTPDLTVVNEETKEEVLIEVSALSFGEMREMASRTYRRIFGLLTADVLWRGDLFPRARIHKSLNTKELEDVAARVQAVIADARSSNEFREMVIEGTMEMCIAPRHEAERSHQWAAERGIEDMPVEGPSFSPYDPIRMKNAIRKEQEQLPGDKPGIVIITADWSLLFFAHGYDEIISSLEESLVKYPKLLCIIVSHTYQSSEEREFVITNRRYTIIKRNTNEELIEETIIAVNNSCTFKVSNSTIEQVRNAFIAD